MRIHETTQQRPIDRFDEERNKLRALPVVPYSTDELESTVVNSHARVRFDTNRYSVPPQLARKTVMVRADDQHVRVVYQGQEVACHQRSFEKRQLIRQDEHLLQAKTMKRCQQKNAVEAAFANLGPAAQTFHLKLLERPVKPMTHLRRLLKLVDLYGRDEVLPAIEQAIQYETCDASYVEAILHQRRRKRELPSPTEVLPRCPEWMNETEYEPTDPASYDRLLKNDEIDSLEENTQDF